MLAHLWRGIAWTYTSMGITGVLQVGVIATTARLLPPEAFGLIAMSNVILRFGKYFARMGVNRALIQLADIDDLGIRAAFTSSTALGILTAATVIAIAPLAGRYYQADDVVAVLRWLALTFLFSSIGATARALLQRRLEFRTTGAIDVTSYAFGYAAPTLALAIAGFGVWSLVAGAIGQVAVSSGIAMLMTRHSLRPTFRITPHKRLLGFGFSVSGISVLEYLGTALDALVIGRFGTVAQMGIYNRAFMLASLPTYQVQHGIARVLFPVLSSGRSDPAAFAHTLGTASRTAIKLVLPLGIGMALTAPEIVRVVLGDQWLETVPVFMVLAPALAMNLLATFPGQALEALGRLRWKAIVQALYVVLLGSALVAIAIDGLDLTSITIVIAIAIGCRTLAVYMLIYLSGAVERSYLTGALGTALAAATVTCVVFVPALAVLRSMGASHLLTLAVAIATGAIVLLALFSGSVVRGLRARGRSRPRAS